MSDQLSVLADICYPISVIRISAKIPYLYNTNDNISYWSQHFDTKCLGALHVSFLLDPLTLSWSPAVLNILICPFAGPPTIPVEHQWPEWHPLRTGINKVASFQEESSAYLCEVGT